MRDLFKVGGLFPQMVCGACKQKGLVIRKNTDAEFILQCLHCNIETEIEDEIQ